jgi:plasmid stabilization system protein ParE
LEIDRNVSVTRVARHLGLSGAFVTVETGKLIKLALLTKQPDPKDRRPVCLRLTRSIERLAGTPRVPVKDFENYLLFYMPRPGGIDIVRVLHGARDIKNIFRNEEI